VSDRPRVLVVDDSNLVLQWTRDTLETAGFEVAVAKDIYVAPLVRRFDPQIILMDVAIGTQKGTVATQALRATDIAPNARIVLFSSKTASELAALATSCGADGWLQKTDDAVAFTNAVRGFLPRA
jgi:DNA-binding response OmpR family regulator